MASIASSSISLKSVQLKGTSTTNYSSVKPSVSSLFLRTKVLQYQPLRFRVSCPAKPETVEKISEIVKQQLSLGGGAEVTGETKFSELGADSLDTLEIMMQLEEQFGLSIGGEEKALTVTTIGEAADLIEKVLEAK